jgi:hypothetical protein
MPREQPEIKETKPQDVVNIVFTVASVHAACITPIIRSRFGRRAFAGYPAAGLWMFFYAGFARCPLLAWYLIPWMLLIVLRRLTSDPNQLSRYQGYPWVFGWMTNEYVARLAEVFICFFAAVFLSTVSIPLAKFVMSQCVALLIVLTTERSLIQARRIAKRDAEIMARHYSEL